LSTNATSVSPLIISRDAADVTQSGSAVDWAIGILTERLANHGVGVTTEPGQTAHLVLITESGPGEFYSFEADGGGTLMLRAADARGFAYGLLDLADAAEPGDSPAGLLSKIRTGGHPASVPVRGIQRNFANVDQDSTWFHDRQFWTDYLDWVAQSRINRLHLTLGMQYNYSHDTVTDNYLCLVYPFLFDVDGFDVHAAAVDALEQQRNLDSLRFIAAETTRRGLHFQLGLWNHAYDYGPESYERFPISGLDADNHADYSAAGLAKLLVECPGIDGFTFRVHYEGGIPEDGHEVFWDKMFAAASASGRELEIDMHAKGVDKLLLDSLAKKPGLHPVISGKYWAEHCGLPYHQASIRAREAARQTGDNADLRGVTNYSRRFTRYGYGDFLAEDRPADLMFRIWPGTQRLLLWGDPELAAGFGRCSTFAGAGGVDLCEPLFFKGRDDTAAYGARDPYLAPDLQLGSRDWTKYKYTYLLWGRLLHDPETDPKIWRRFLADTYGVTAVAVEGALSALSKVLPLVTVTHGASGSNNLYWPEMYANLPISARVHTGTPISERKPDPRAEALGISYAYSVHIDEAARGEALIDYTADEESELIDELLIHDTDDAKNWGGISPFDPTLFYAVDEYVDDLVNSRLGAKYTPLDVAGWLEELVRIGEQHLVSLRAEQAGTQLQDVPDAAQLRRTVLDLEILARLGTFFAGKFRAAVHYSAYTATKDRSLLEACIAAYLPAREAYAEIATLVDGVYQPHLMFGKEPYEGGTWADRVPAIDRDIAALRAELDEALVDSHSRLLENLPERLTEPNIEHRPPIAFDRGQPLTLSVEGGDDLLEVVLHYRHVDQSQTFQRVTMAPTDDGYVGTIDGEYTASHFPLMYFFSVKDRTGRQAIVPGFEPGLANQPYLLLHSAQRER
jgi:hypothetical protein